MRTQTLAFVCALACSLACSGCSYALMRPAPATPERLDWVDCTSSRIPPVADSVGVVQGIALALLVELFDGVDLTGEGDGNEAVSTEGRVMQIAALGVSGVYLASAVHGFRSADDCERAKALSNLHQLEEVKAAESAPLALPAAPPGCQGDAECKGGRRCVAGSCAWPEPAPPTPAPAATPAPSPPAPAP